MIRRSNIIMVTESLLRDITMNNTVSSTVDLKEIDHCGSTINDGDTPNILMLKMEGSHGNVKLKRKSPKHSKHKSNDTKRSVGEELHHFDADKTIVTDEDENSRRRTVELVNTTGTWGFTLQTYAVRHKQTGEIDIMTYIDYVETSSAAWLGGIRRGDVIIAVNGENVQYHTHRQLVEVIRRCSHTMRLVVLFDDCCRKVELHDRFFKLKALLRSKIKELKSLEENERHISEGMSFLSRSDLSRASLISTMTTSSVASWDRFSMVSSPFSIEDLSRQSNYGSKENLYVDASDTASEASSTPDHIDADGDQLPGDFYSHKQVALLRYRKIHGNFPDLDASGGRRHGGHALPRGYKLSSLSASCINLGSVTRRSDRLVKSKSSSDRALRNCDERLSGDFDSPEARGHTESSPSVERVKSRGDEDRASDDSVFLAAEDEMFYPVRDKTEKSTDKRDCSIQRAVDFVENTKNFGDVRFHEKMGASVPWIEDDSVGADKDVVSTECCVDSETGVFSPASGRPIPPRELVSSKEWCGERLRLSGRDEDESCVGESDISDGFTRISAVDVFVGDCRLSIARRSDGCDVMRRGAVVSDGSDVSVSAVFSDGSDDTNSAVISDGSDVTITAVVSDGTDVSISAVVSDGSDDTNSVVVCDVSDFKVGAVVSDGSNNINNNSAVVSDGSDDNNSAVVSDKSDDDNVGAVTISAVISDRSNDTKSAGVSDGRDVSVSVFVSDSNSHTHM